LGIAWLFARRMLFFAGISFFLANVSYSVGKNGLKLGFLNHPNQGFSYRL
jgi:hypothetical protein